MVDSLTILTASEAGSKNQCGREKTQLNLNSHQEKKF